MMRRCYFGVSLWVLFFFVFSSTVLFADEENRASSIVNSGPSENKNSVRLTDYYESGDVSLDYLPDDSVDISFTDAITLALKQNLELQAATYNTRSVAASLKSAYGLYDPVLKVDFKSGEMRDILNLSFFSSPTENEYQESSVSLIQKLPFGTELTLAGTLREDDALPAPTINPSHDSQVSLGIVQPVLKGFGPTVFAQKVVFASSDKQIALQDLRQQAFSVVAAVRNAYLGVLQSQYELSYRQTSVELARRIVQENNARVKAGILAPVEKLEAEVGLQARERLLLDSHRNFDDALDQFNLLINAEEKIYLPIIQNFNMNYQTSEEAGIQSGLMKRPDVIRRMKEIEKVRTERTIARNSLLPELDVVASYSQNGLSDNADDSIEITKDGDYDSWEVGVRFSYPLGSIESRNEVKRSEIRLRQERALLTQLRNEVRRDVRSAIRNIDVSRKKTEVAKRGHDLAREKLRILLKSREVGLATTRDVLDGEEDLASARTDQITSVADYFKAVTEYLRVTGTLLESENIVFEGDVSPDNERIPFYRR